MLYANFSGLWKIWIDNILLSIIKESMGLAFEAIYPDIYPVAYKLFETGMERHNIAGEVFKQFGIKWNIPENKLHTAMIDLSITCAENDFRNKLEKGAFCYENNNICGKK